MNPRNASADASLPLIDLIKVLASQLILLHHFALYGPLSDVVNPTVPAVADWLLDYGRLAVQAFLVVGGFLAARSFLQGPAAQGPAALPRQLARRYRRLVPPYAVALAVAIVAAAVARWLIVHPTIPEAPSLWQVAAHLLLLQDIAGVAALSAGIWYVSIDFQLYAVFSAIATRGRRQGLLLCAALTIAALFWFNRHPGLDVWAPYFFGAYGLGAMAYRVSEQPRRMTGALLLGAVVALALVVEWRSRILVAGVTAVCLALSGGQMGVPAAWRRVVARLSAISYPLFLLHYPVLLVVGAVVHRLWPHSVAGSAAGLLGAWALSLLAAQWLHQWVEAKSRR